MQKIELNIPLRLHANWSAIAQCIEAALTGPDTQAADYKARIEIRNPLPVLVIGFTHTKSDGFHGDVREALAYAGKSTVDPVYALAYRGAGDTVTKLGEDIYQPEDGDKYPLSDFIRA